MYGALHESSGHLRYIWSLKKIRGPYTAYGRPRSTLDHDSTLPECAYAVHRGGHAHAHAAAHS